MTDIGIFSFGGGVQSTAALVLAARREIDIKQFVFANTGDDSESAATLSFIERIAKPYAKAHGLSLETVAKKQTLYENLVGANRTIAIPVYLRTQNDEAAPGNRKCTSDWKIKPIASFLRKLGAKPKQPGVVAIGISTDECHRAKDSQIASQTHSFPLLDLGISRLECGNIIREAGLEVPPKSACWFCPYKKLKEWRRMAAEEPELFERAAKLEAKLEAKRGDMGKDSIFLTRTLKPLSEAVLPSEQLSLFDDDCTGYCWT